MTFKNLSTLILIFALTLGNQAFAGVFFNIKNEDATKTKILFFGFDPADPNARQDAFEIFERVRRNLKTTDLFEVVKNSGRIEIVGDKSEEVVDPKAAIDPKIRRSQMHKTRLKLMENLRRSILKIPIKHSINMRGLKILPLILQSRFRQFQ